MSELFSAGTAGQPLAARMAPRTLDEFSGQNALLGPGKLLRRLVESGKFTSALFFGPPGCGKTALARHIAEKSNAEVVELNAVTAGVADIRKAVDQAKYSATSLGRKTLLLVDEIHHFNKTQQDALLPSVERGDVLLIGLTTENPGFYVNAALRSRVTAFEFFPIPEDELTKILDKACADRERGVGSMKVVMTPEARTHLVRQAGGDAAPNYSSMEGYVAAKVFAEGLKRAGGNPTRDSLITGLESMQRFDAGGYLVSFGAHDHQGSSFVDLSMLTGDGKVRH